MSTAFDVIAAAARADLGQGNQDTGTPELWAEDWPAGRGPYVRSWGRGKPKGLLLSRFRHQHPRPDFRYPL